MKKTLIIGLLSISTFFSFGQQSENHNNQADSARVFVSFIVETDGSITDVKIDKLECFKCSKTFKKNIKKEAVRVVRATPNMGEQKEKVKCVLPIKFKLEDWQETKWFKLYNLKQIE